MEGEALDVRLLNESTEVPPGPTKRDIFLCILKAAWPQATVCPHFLLPPASHLLPP